jgi:hypothetical protein
MLLPLTLLAAGLATPALAAPGATTPAVVVWMSPTAPSSEIRRLAEKETGVAEHRAWADIDLTPEVFAAADEQRVAALTGVMKDGAAHWEEFDAESGVARAIAAAVEPISVLRDVNERDALRAALLWEGAGITRGYPENLFSSLQDTVAFRINVAGKSTVRPWVDAIALDPKHVFVRSEFPDGQSFARVQQLQQELGLLPKARISVDPLPPGAQLVVDGVLQPAEAREVEIAAGHHYAHLVLGGAIYDRQEFDAAPSDNIPLRLPVSPEELSTAATAVMGGSSDVGADVSAAVRSMAGRMANPPRVFLGVVDEKGRPKLVAFSGGATIVKKRPVVVLFNGELGGGILNSQGFSGSRGEEATTYQFGGTLGLELGIYNFCLLAAADMALAPSVQMAYGVEGGETPEDNEQISAFFRPHGGVGVYLPRPQANKVWVLLAGSYGWMSPASLGGGGQLTVGLPLADGQTWVRLTLDGYRGTQLEGFAAEGTPTSAASLRVGFGSRL